MPNIKTVAEKGQNAMVTLDTGVVAWSPDYKAAVALIGKPLPEGWLLKDNKQGTGKVLLPPKPGGGGGGTAQSKEAFDAEARSRAAWQLVEEEHKDRRTALMTAADKMPTGAMDSEYERKFTRLYDFMLDLLRSSPVAGGTLSGTRPGPRGHNAGCLWGSRSRAGTGGGTRPLGPPPVPPNIRSIRSSVTTSSRPVGGSGGTPWATVPSAARRSWLRWKAPRPTWGLHDTPRAGEGTGTSGDLHDA